MGIDNNYRNMGIGRKFVEYALKESKDSKIYCEVKEDNHITLNICKTHRFKEISYSPENNEYVFRLDG